MNVFEIIENIKNINDVKNIKSEEFSSKIKFILNSENPLLSNPTKIQKVKIN